MRGKKRENEKSITVKMDTELAEKVDSKRWKMKTDRTTQVVKACEFYVSAITCPKCGTLNDQKSNYCSVCQEPLSETAKGRERMKELLDAVVTNDERYHKILEYAKKISASG
jgi:phage FluMu protein Com